MEKHLFLNGLNQEKAAAYTSPTFDSTYNFGLKWDTLTCVEEIRELFFIY